MSKLIALATGAAGYVLGARAGREQYKAIVDKATELWSDPRVQQRKDQVAGVAKSTATQAKTRMSNDGDTSSRDSGPTDTGRNVHEMDPTATNPSPGAVR